MNTKALPVTVPATIFNDFCNIFNQVSIEVHRALLDEIGRLAAVVKEHGLRKVSRFFEEPLAFFFVDEDDEEKEPEAVSPRIDVVSLNVTDTGFFWSGHLGDGTYWETDAVSLVELGLSPARASVDFLSQALNEGDGVYRP